MSQISRFVRLVLLLLVAAVVAGGAQAAKAPAPIAIDAVTIGDGVAVVTGAVDDATAQLEVNGQLVDVSDAGEFVTSVDLDSGALVLSLIEPQSESVTLRIPIEALVAHGGDGVLNDLVDAGVSVEVPLDGFTVVDGQWSPIAGHLIDDSRLASLTINGVHVLERIGPMGGFSIQLPWSQAPPSQVTVVATDRRGVSQTTTYRAARVQSVIRTRTGTSVSAAGARGLVIAGFRLDKRQLVSTGRLRLLVTVKDRRGHLVRGAALRLAASPRLHLATGPIRAGFTNRTGRAQFTYRLRPNAFCGGQRASLTIATSAKTPTASVFRKASLQLPVVADR